jgi:hypothetical protein
MKSAGLARSVVREEDGGPVLLAALIVFLGVSFY